MNTDYLPTATVTEVVATRSNLWDIHARCPEGRAVIHGGGLTTEPPQFGPRVSHCRGIPSLRSRPACSHRDYVLTAASPADAAVASR